MSRHVRTAAQCAERSLIVPGRRGRLVMRVDDSGTHEFTYGALGEITATHDELAPEGGVGPTIADTLFTYDSFGRVRSVRYPDNELVTYGSDASPLAAA